MPVRNVWLLVLTVSALALVGACASTDSGITTAVKAKLAMDDVVKSSQIEVATNDGTVTLTGNVDSEEAKDRALELARNTAGAVHVVDMISARQASENGNAPDADRTLGEVVQDSGITMSVKTQLLDEPLVQGLKIDVDTRDGVVFLTGTVRSDVARKKAIQLARETNGVRDVKANLTIAKG